MWSRNCLHLVFVVRVVQSCGVGTANIWCSRFVGVQSGVRGSCCSFWCSWFVLFSLVFVVRVVQSCVRGSCCSVWCSWFVLFSPSFSMWCFVYHCLSFCSFFSAIVLSLLLHLAASDYPFGIFKLFFC